MSGWQVEAELGNGATVRFGVEASTETGALLSAYQRLAWFPHTADHVRVAELVAPADRRRQ